MATNSTPDSIAPETYPIRSPYRPLPRAAREALADTATILEELEADETGRNGGVIVDERPPEDLLEEYELEIDLPLHKANAHKIDASYESIWRSPENDLVVIYPDLVEVNGREYDLDPDSARERAEDRMERLV